MTDNPLLRRWLTSTVALAVAATLMGTPVERATAQETVRYQLTDLGDLGGGPEVAVDAINDAGQVVGTHLVDSVGYRGFLYHGGSWVMLGTLGGAYSSAAGLNETQQVVGTSEVTPVAGNGALHGFVWKDGVMGDLGALLPHPEDESQAVDVNEDGDVVGWSRFQDSGGSFWDHAVLWTSGGIVDLGLLAPPGSPGNSRAYAINDDGYVVGESDLQDFAGTHAFLWKDGVMTSLGALPGESFSVAYDINNRGQVVGESRGRGFLWQSFTMNELVGIVPSAINDHGQVVGHQTYCPLDSEECEQRALLYEGGLLHDLNALIDPASGWTLHTATDINDVGQIVGMGSVGGEQHGYLLTPIIPAPPEDTTPPSLQVPGDLTVDATSPLGAEVSYSVSASDDLDPAPVVECDPPSGATFPIGTTGVTCVATDAAGNTTTAGFQVTVLGANEQLQQLTSEVIALPVSPFMRAVLVRLLFLAQAALDVGGSDAACGLLRAFAGLVEATAGRLVPADDASHLLDAANRVWAVIGCR